MGAGCRAARKKLGLLEKHKDYVLRARDYHRKEKEIKTLKSKAEFRNPDEFYYAMQSQRTKEGVHAGSVVDDSKYTHQQMQLMKTQDASYVQLKAQVDEKKASRLKSSLHFIGLPAKNKHTVFVEDGAAVRRFDAAAHFDTDASLLGRTFNRPRTAQLEDEAAVSGSRGVDGGDAGSSALKLAKEGNRQRMASYKELEGRLQRAQKMRDVAQGMALQKQLMGKGHKRKLTETNDETGAKQTVYRWKKDRKK